MWGFLVVDELLCRGVAFLTFCGAVLHHPFQEVQGTKNRLLLTVCLRLVRQRPATRKRHSVRGDACRDRLEVDGLLRLAVLRRIFARAFVVCRTLVAGVVVGAGAPGGCEDGRHLLADLEEGRDHRRLFPRVLPPESVRGVREVLREVCASLADLVDKVLREAHLRVELAPRQRQLVPRRLAQQKLAQEGQRRVDALGVEHLLHQVLGRRRHRARHLVVQVEQLARRGDDVRVLRLLQPRVAQVDLQRRQRRAHPPLLLRHVDALRTLGGLVPLRRVQALQVVVARHRVVHLLHAVRQHRGEGVDAFA
eukprot:Rhum_TRINITY_DN5774_c0_g1::Rhum_TRINITY_DN5774_c0_g1_i1::g.18314::m.18314